MLFRLIIFLLLAAGILWLFETEAGRQRVEFAPSVNQVWLKFCVGNAREKISEPAVTLARITENHEPLLPDTTELTQLDFATLLGALSRFEPTSVSVAPVLAWEGQDVFGQPGLKLNSLTLPKLTLGAEVKNDKDADPAGLKGKFPVIENVSGDVSKLSPVSAVTAFPDAEVLTNGTAGFTHIQGLEGTVSEGKKGNTAPKVALLARAGEEVIPSFLLLSILSYEGLDVGAVRVELPPAAKTASVRIDERIVIPIDKEGRLKVYLNAGISGASVQRLESQKLHLAAEIGDQFADFISEDKAAIESLGKNLVMIGYDRAADRQLSLGEWGTISRAELLARCAATIQSGRYIEMWPLWLRASSYGIIFLGALLIFRLERRRVPFWGVVFAFLFFGSSLIIFKGKLLWTSPLPGLGLIVLMILTGLILPPSRSREKSDKANKVPKKGATPYKTAKTSRAEKKAAKKVEKERAKAMKKAGEEKSKSEKKADSGESEKAEEKPAEKAPAEEVAAGESKEPETPEDSKEADAAAKDESAGAEDAAEKEKEKDSKTD